MVRSVEAGSGVVPFRCATKFQCRCETLTFVRTKRFIVKSLIKLTGPPRPVDQLKDKSLPYIGPQVFRTQARDLNRK